MKAFISYSTHDKQIAHRVQKILEEHHIEAFLAHEDIQVSEEWQKRIIKELENSEVFIPLLSANFKTSDWAPQEVGFAVGRKALIIPLSIDNTTPFGFISHIQSKPIDKNGDILVDKIIKRFPRKMIPLLIERLADAQRFDDGREFMKQLSPYFQKFSNEEVNAFVSASIKNDQIWRACYYRKNDDLLQFIQLHKSKIDAKELEILRYQMKEGAEYRED